MLTELRLTGYRAFRDFAIHDLGRVNLIVGRNNSGKTSVLEAVRLLAAGGDPVVMASIALDRGETIAVDIDGQDYGRGWVADISHFFHGHEFGLGASFSVGAPGGVGSACITVVERSEFASKQGSVIYGAGASRPVGSPIQIDDHSLVLRVDGPDGRAFGGYVVSDDGGFEFDPALASRTRTARRAPAFEPWPSISISPTSLQPGAMAGMWEQVVREGQELEAVEALRLLEPRIESIVFLPTERPGRAGRGGILVGLKGSRRRMPLGSMGEGMRRLLALTLGLVQARKGFLLVDEIDTGLHWSVMPDIWKLLMHAAEEQQVQVIATTHSLDCLRGLGEACAEAPAHRDSVRVHKLDLSLSEAVTFTSDQIAIALDQDIEVRG